MTFEDNQNDQDDYLAVPRDLSDNGIKSGTLSLDEARHMLSGENAINSNIDTLAKKTSFEACSSVEKGDKKKNLHKSDYSSQGKRVIS